MLVNLFLLFTPFAVRTVGVLPSAALVHQNHVNWARGVDTPLLGAKKYGEG